MTLLSRPVLIEEVAYLVTKGQLAPTFRDNFVIGI